MKYERIQPALSRKGILTVILPKIWARGYDNIFVERLWRSVKYEEVYLHDYQTVAEAVAGLGRYFGFYNHERPHQAFAGLTPAEVYGLTPPPWPVQTTGMAGAAERLAAGRVGAGPCGPEPLAEPDLWIAHPALQVVISLAEQVELSA